MEIKLRSKLIHTDAMVSMVSMFSLNNSMSSGLLAPKMPQVVKAKQDENKKMTSTRLLY